MTVGIVNSLREDTAGSTLLQGLAVDDTELVVTNAADFDGADALRVAGQELAIDRVLFKDRYESGVTQDTVVLAAPSPVAETAGRRVDVSPVDVEYVAEVFIGDARTPADATVPSHLADDLALKLSTGGLETRVRLRWEDDEGWVVARVLGKRLSRDGRAIAAATVQPEAVDDDAWIAAGKPTDLLNKDSAHHPGLTLVGPTIQSSADDAGLSQLKISPAGLSFTDATGKPLVTTPTEPGGRPHWTGLGDFDSMAVDTGSVAQQLDLQPGSVVNAASQFSAPSHGPTTTSYWGFIPIPGLHIDQSGITGLVRYSGAHYTVCGPTTGRDSYLTRLDDDGTITNLYVTPTPLFTTNGLTRIGTKWWLGGSVAGQTVIWGMSSTGVLDAAPIPYARVSTSPLVPVVGTDGTNILVADVATNSKRVKVTRIDPGTGAVVSVTTLPSLPATNPQLAGIDFGSFDFGENCYVVWADFEKKRQVLVARAADLSDWDDDRNFDFANDEAISAAGWASDLSRFTSIGSFSDGIWKYANNGYDGYDQSSLVAHSWYNPEPYETTLPTTYTQIKVPRRGGLRVNVGTLPGGGGLADPTTARVYLTNSDGLSLVQWHLQGTTDPLTGELVIVDPTPVTGANPPASNSFPAGAYAVWTRDGAVVMLQPVGDGTYIGELPSYLESLIAAAAGGSTENANGQDYIVEGGPDGTGAFLYHSDGVFL